MTKHSMEPIIDQYIDGSGYRYNDLSQVNISHTSLIRYRKICYLIVQIVASGITDEINSVIYLRIVRLTYLIQKHREHNKVAISNNSYSITLQS